MTIPLQQQSLAILTERGSIGTLVVGVDQPGPGEVLVQVEAAGLNPIDWKFQATDYSRYLTHYPAILGQDSAGVVVALGEGVTNVSVGDRVLHQGHLSNRMATFKQYTIVPSDVVARIPDNLTFDQAASIPLALVTAVIGLYNKKWDRGGAELTAPWRDRGRGKYTGQPIVIFGGSSSVGQFAIQCANLSGFSPIITTVSPRNNDLVMSLGATHTLDRGLPDLVNAVKRITSEPVKLVYDAVAIPSTQLPAYDILAPGGKLILVLFPCIPEEKLSSDKEIICTYGSVYPDDNRELGRELFGNLTGYLQSGDIKANAVEVLSGGFGGVLAGLQRLQRSEVSGRKLIGHPQDEGPVKTAQCCSRK